MDVHNIIACFLFLLLTIVQIEKNDAIHIKIDPEKYNKIATNNVHISCVADKGAKNIMMIQIYHDSTPIAVIRQGTNLSFGNVNQTRLSADGNIDQGTGQAYLNLTITSPRTNDCGVYTCVMYFLDVTNVLKEDRANNNFTEEKIDHTLLETMLIDKVSSMENAIKELTKKVITTSAFSATNNKSTIQTSDGNVLILPDVIMSQGQGYNQSTGVFTAPVNGLYVFHLVVTENKHCGTRLDLKANDAVLARLFAYDRTYSGQSSISSVVDLNAGDKVFAVMRDNRCLVLNNQYTVFTGYLIKAF